MRKSTSILVGVMFLVILTCSAEPMQSQESLNKQAQDIFTARFKKAFGNCGDSYYTLWDKSLIWQLKGAYVSAVIPQAVKEVERMNGLEYSGRATLSAKFRRTQGGFNKKVWGPWSQEKKPYYLYVKKTKGQWVTSGFFFGGPGGTFDAVKCSAVPKD